MTRAGLPVPIPIKKTGFDIPSIPVMPNVKLGKMLGGEGESTTESAIGDGLSQSGVSASEFSNLNSLRTIQNGPPSSIGSVTESRVSSFVNRQSMRPLIGSDRSLTGSSVTDSLSRRSSVSTAPSSATDVSVNSSASQVAPQSSVNPSRTGYSEGRIANSELTSTRLTDAPPVFRGTRPSMRPRYVGSDTSITPSMSGSQEGVLRPASERIPSFGSEMRGMISNMPERFTETSRPPVRPDRMSYGGNETEMRSITEPTPASAIGEPRRTMENRLSRPVRGDVYDRPQTNVPRANELASNVRTPSEVSRVSSSASPSETSWMERNDWRSGGNVVPRNASQLSSQAQSTSRIRNTRGIRQRFGGESELGSTEMGVPSSNVSTEITEPTGGGIYGTKSEAPAIESSASTFAEGEGLSSAVASSEAMAGAGAAEAGLAGDIEMLALV